MSTEAYYIDPVAAQTWWDSRGVNRHINPRRSRILADMMVSGKWLPTRQPIIFERRQLVDGQHRVMAIILSGIVVPCAVAYDERPPELEDLHRYYGPFYTKPIDTGRARSSRDSLIISRQLDGKRVLRVTESGVVNFIGQNIIGLSPVPMHVADELADSFDDHLDAITSIINIKIPGLRRASVVTAFVMARACRGLEVDGLATKFTSVIGLDGTHPMYRLRQHLLTHSLSGGSCIERDLFLRSSNAIAQALDGKTCNKLYPTPGPAVDIVTACGFPADNIQWLQVRKESHQ